MATPGQLVECVASALNVPRATVVLYDRVLAENGLRSKGGRGKSAAQVTAEDAANLLIAIAGTGSSGIASAAATVQQFSALSYSRRKGLRELVAEYSPQEAGELAQTQEVELIAMPGMEGLRSNHSFREGLVSLIEAVRQQKITFESGVQADLYRAFVSLEGLPIRGGISIALNNGTSADARYGSTGRNVQFSDLHWRQTFSHRTILAVAVLLGVEDVSPRKSRGAA